MLTERNYINLTGIYCFLVLNFQCEISRIWAENVSRYICIHFLFSCPNRFWWKQSQPNIPKMSTSPFIPRAFQAYIHKTHMHIDNFLRFFVVQFRKSWKLFSSIGNLLPPSCSAFNTRRGQDFFRPFFFRMHHKKRAAPSQRYWGKVTFDQWHQLQSYIWEKEVVLLL